MDEIIAKGLTASPASTNVTYKGMPVFIESIDNAHFTASIHPLNEPNKRQTVNISSLIQNWS